MNISKGLDRIAIVLAMLALFPGGFIGLAYTYHILNEVHPAIETSPDHADISLIWWKVLLYISGSILGAGVSFFVVLFGIRGATRGIRKLSLWVMEWF
jgi:hypothetical protein